MIYVSKENDLCEKKRHRKLKQWMLAINIRIATKVWRTTSDCLPQYR